MEGDKENKKIRGLFRYICLTKDGQAIFSRWNSRILDKYLILAVFLRGIYIIGVNAESTDELSRETIWQLLKTLKVFDELAKNSSLIQFSDIKDALGSQKSKYFRNPIIHFGHH